MAEIIERIEKVTLHGGEHSWVSREGYVVMTNEQKIYLTIGNDQSCCEVWGYFMSDDDLDYYLGAELLGVEVTDEALSKEAMDTHNVSTDGDLNETSVMFVDILTNKGVLQFVAHNTHNGYYGHIASVTSKQVSKEKIV